jgi:hypothetical protein
VLHRISCLPRAWQAHFCRVMASAAIGRDSHNAMSISGVNPPATEAWGLARQASRGPKTEHGDNG